MTTNKLIFGLKRRVPVILQTEAAECGLACLAMIANYHQFACDLTSLRRRFSLSIKGVTFADLAEMASSLRFHARPVSLDLPAFPKLCLPAILHWNFKHFVVLTRVTKDHVVIHDPARGSRKMSWTEVSQSFTGAALEIYPAKDFEAKEERQTIGFRPLLGHISGLMGTAVRVLLLAAALEFLAILTPLFLQLIVDNAIVTRDIELVKVLGFGFLLIGLLKIVIDSGRSWLLLYMGTHVTLQLSANLMRHLLRLPMSFFEKRHVGDIVSRFDSINVIQRTLTTKFISAFIDGSLAVITLCVMLAYSRMLTGVVLIAAAVYFASRAAMYRPNQVAVEEYIVKASKQNSHFLESIRGIQSLKLFNRVALRKTAWIDLMVGSFNASIRSQQLALVSNAFKSFVFCIENVTVIALGAVVTIEGTLSVGMLVAFISYKIQFIDRINALIDNYLEFRMLGLHRDRVADIALSQPEPNGDESSNRVSFRREAPPSIVLKNVSFRFSEHEPYVIRNLNLTIMSGESVAIVGSSGCGKTTLMKLMLGLLEPTSGEILVDNLPLQYIGVQAYREHIGAVMQDDQLFAGSIMENIGFFDPGLNRDRVEACAMMAAIHDDIATMPMRYSTLVGDMGSALSGGQKQRVLLARALYKNPLILFLDEATSHLDVGLEKLVNQAVSRIPMTKVIIAHRPETIASADRIIRLEKRTGQNDEFPEENIAATG